RLQDCFTTVINNRLLCEALRAVEARILELPAALVAAWLRGVFDGDGCVRVDAKSPQVIISAWGGKANRFIRDAFLRVGIVTSLAPNAHEGKDGNIVIAGIGNLRRFLRRIGSGHPAKKIRLGELRALLRGRAVCSSR